MDSAGICNKVVTFSILIFTGVITFSGAALIMHRCLKIGTSIVTVRAVTARNTVKGTGPG